MCERHALRMDLSDGALHLRRELLADGLTDTELHQLRRTAQLHTVRRGAYVPAGDERLLDAAARHALLVHATVPCLAGGAVVSHVSAAVLHGLPVWAAPLKRVHVTRDGGSGGRISSLLHLHMSPLREDEIVDVDGVAVTSVARTVVDLALLLPFEQALVIADGALFSGRVDAAGLNLAYARSASRRGRAAARRVLDFADGRSESVGESRSRVAIRMAGLPAPTVQWEVWAPDGRLLGRADFGWPELRTIGEFDGKAKYGRLLQQGQSAADVVYAEKLREDRLRAMGLSVVRWTWDDLDHFAPIAARLRQQFRLK
jgi:hypothetical protein